MDGLDALNKLPNLPSKDLGTIVMESERESCVIASYIVNSDPILDQFDLHPYRLQPQNGPTPHLDKYHVAHSDWMPNMDVNIFITFTQTMVCICFFAPVSLRCGTHLDGLLSSCWYMIHNDIHKLMAYTDSFFLQVGTGITNALINARRAIDKTFAGEADDVPILSTSVAYGVYIAVSSNLRYVDFFSNHYCVHLLSFHLRQFFTPSNVVIFFAAEIVVEDGTSTCLLIP